MNRRQFLHTQAALVGAALPAFAADNITPPKAAPTRGVSLAGPEFGTHQPAFCNDNPGVFGRDYTYNSERTTHYFCQHKLPLLRIPFRWERIQPRLGQDLNAAELDRLKTAVAWARRHEGNVILDVHNYGRYIFRRDGKPFDCIIDQVVDGKVPVTRADFGDLWARLSRVFHDEPTVHAYGLMNEPHDMGKSDWKLISQEAVDAIRARKDHKLILVAGDSWSNCPLWVRVNGPTAWIKDRADRIAYEAHCYFDRDYSGRYKSTYDQELADDPRLEHRGVERLAPFVGWCRINGVAGFLGEFGVPGERRWLLVLKHFLSALSRAEMEGCYWAAGEWWHDYPLSVQPRDDFRKPAPQLAVLEP